jgi:hypothetical protein
MTRIETRLRLLWLALACATLASSLAGCGGGGGGSAPPPPPPASESAYLLAEFVAADTNNQYVRIWDPAHPSVAVQNVKLVMSNGIMWTSSHLVFSDARTYDPATHTFTTQGHAKVFYDNDGKLYAIDLRGGQSHAPVRLSSAVDVFLPAGVTPMDAAGDDAWVDAQGGTHHWAIRSTMSATDAAVSVQQVLAPLRDAATGVPRYFFASLGSQDGIHVTPTTYQTFDASFVPVAVPAIGSMTASDGWVGVDPAQPGLGYVRIAGQLHKLQWSGAGVAVDGADLYDFVNFGQIQQASDTHTLWFNDGGVVVGVANGAVQALGTLSATPSQLIDAGDYVAAAEIVGVSSTQTLTRVDTLRKSDGHRTTVADATVDVVLLGASSQGLLIAGTVEAGRAVSLVSGDKRSETTLGNSLQYVGAVRSASTRMDQPAAPVAVLACAAGADDGFCAAGTLTQVSLAGDATSLGTLAATAPWVRGDAIAGLASALSGQQFLPGPGGFATDETDQRDAWQFTPATAGSLTRVTSNVP